MNNPFEATDHRLNILEALLVEIVTFVARLAQAANLVFILP